MALPRPCTARSDRAARLALLIAMAGCERRRALVQPCGPDRDGTLGWFRDFLTAARAARLTLEA